VVRHIFQACPVWIYTQSNITSIIYICFYAIERMRGMRVGETMLRRNN
jgi:hypothetical protein